MYAPDTDRRRFIKHLGGAFTLLATSSLSAWAKHYGPNDKIRLATIGMGIQGFSDTKAALATQMAELVAVCDLYDGRLTRAKEVFGNQLFTTRDFREILEKPDIDAVIIATPDHWHDHISIAALNKGKHVYCEKPMVHHIAEGKAVIEAHSRSGKVMQVGSQRISSVVFAEAKRRYLAGDIGDLNMVVATNDRHSALGAWQYSIPPDASPQTLDWDRFLGDAPKRAYDPVRFFRWRNYKDYGTGVPGDLYVHLITGLHYITGSLGPNKIYAAGHLALWKDGRDVPDVTSGIMEYPQTDKHSAFQVMLRANFADGSGGGSSTRLVGTEGVIEVFGNRFVLKKEKLATAPGYGSWDSFDTFPKAVQEEFVKQYDARYPKDQRQTQRPADETYNAPAGHSEHTEHFRNFFEGIREGKPVIEDPTFGLRAAGPSLAVNLSIEKQKVIRWDAEKMKLG
jgi:predicted dehydrogenase